jgi:regulator of nonsense transcripts 1
MNNTSKCNETEAKFIISLIALLAKKISSSTSEDKNLSEKIGIISPYKSQVRLIKQLLFKNSHKIKLDIKGIEVNTVDAFQGREKDFIIISTVRTEGMGFLRDTRRLNVAITRPRHFLWIVGNSNCLN